MVSEQASDLCLGLRRDLPVLINTVEQILGSDIGRHNQDRILEINSTSLGIGNPSVIQHLKQDIEDIRMRFLDLVE